MRATGLAVAATLATTLAMAIAWTGTAGAWPYVTAEFGHCVKSARGEGGSGYHNAGCTEAVAEGAKYHWVSGPGSKRGFTANASGVDFYVFSGRYGLKATPKVECSSASTAGEYTSAKTESLTLALSGCRMASASCQSEAEPAGDVLFSPLEGLLIKSGKGYDGEALIRWSPAIGETLASFECGGTSVTLSDSILREIKRNKMVSAETEQFKVWKEGSQRPSCYEPCMPGEQPTTTIGDVAYEWSGLSMSGTQADEETIEADAVLP
jgi:hypothetical protein